MTREQFIEGQNRIYELLRRGAADIAISGLRPEKNLAEMRGGYTVAFIHPSHISSVFSSLSCHVARIVPSVAYRAGDIHTTIGMCGKGPGFLYEAKPEQRRILAALCATTERLLERYQSSALSIDFKEYLLTPETLLAAGTPNEAFVLFVQEAVGIAREHGITLEPAWGAHVTVARFKVSAPRDAASAVLQCVRRAELPTQSVATELAVGYSLWAPSPECPATTPEELQGQFVAFRRYHFL